MREQDKHKLINNPPGTLRRLRLQAFSTVVLFDDEYCVGHPALDV